MHKTTASMERYTEPKGLDSAFIEGLSSPGKVLFIKKCIEAFLIPNGL